MRRILALAALLAFLPTAHAQDKGKADFSHNAELRFRYWWMQNPTGDKDSLGTASQIDSRFKWGTNFKANEKLSANLTLLHNATFGEDTNTESVGNTNNDTEDMLTVNQAYANWMFSDDMNFRVGRQNFQIGDGTLIGFNDWEANPGAFEGVVGNWMASFGTFQLFMFKYRELTATGTHPAAGSSAAGDPEQNAYGLNFDLKTTQDWFKALNVHVVKDNGDAIAGNTTHNVQTGLSGHDLLRYGLMAGFNFNIVDLKAWYEMQSGSYKDVAATGVVTEVDAKGSMMQAEVGVNLESFMNSRVHFRYHADSGDSGTGSATETEAYDPYFYEQHNTAGMMDLFQWGNLTFMQLGWAGKLNDKTSMGVAYTMFSRTEDGAGSTAVTDGSQGNWGGTPDATKDKLGDEIDLWAEHMYDGGLSMLFQLGYFQPGDYYDSGVTPAAEDKIMQVLVQGKLTF